MTVLKLIKYTLTYISFIGWTNLTRNKRRSRKRLRIKAVPFFFLVIGRLKVSIFDITKSYTTRYNVILRCIFNLYSNILLKHLVLRCWVRATNILSFKARSSMTLLLIQNWTNNKPLNIVPLFNHVLRVKFFYSLMFQLMSDLVWNKSAVESWKINLVNKIYLVYSTTTIYFILQWIKGKKKSSSNPN